LNPSCHILRGVEKYEELLSKKDEVKMGDVFSGLYSGGEV